jgi:gliding motility-associated-like protein
VTDNFTGCFVETIYVVDPYSDLVAEALNPTPVSCFGDADGTIQLDVNDVIAGYTSTYTYTVLDAAGTPLNPVTYPSSTGTGTAPGTITITGLPAGIFTINVVQDNAPFCVDTTNAFTIISPSAALVANLALTNFLTCTLGDTGQITASGSFGYPTYTYQFDEINALGGTVITNLQAAGNPNAVISNLAAGFYRVTVTDAGGCSEIDELEIVAPNLLNVSAVGDNLSCHGDLNGVVTATSTSPFNVDPNTGNDLLYTFALNLLDASNNILSTSAPQFSGVFSDLAAGNYSVTIEDGVYCGTTSNIVQVIQPDRVDVDARITALNDCTMGAEITVSATGGDGNYEFRISDPAAFVTAFSSTTVYPNLPPGRYEFEARDGNNCISIPTAVVTINAIPALVLSVDTSAAFVNCSDENTAMVFASATGGVGNYEYTLSGPALAADIVNATGVFRDLFAGDDYLVTVTSGGCTPDTFRFSIANPPELLLQNVIVTNVSCPGENDGTITILAQGGTPELLYAISPNLDRFDDRSVFNDLGPGTYFLIVSDGNGCPITREVIIEPATQVSITTATFEQACGDVADGEIMLGLSGGASPYSVSLNNPSGPFVPVTDINGNYSFENLEGGQTYTVYVRDANGCEYTVAVPLLPPTNVNATYVPIYNCDTNEYDLEVTLANPQFANSVDYILYDASGTEIRNQRTNVFTNILPADDYEILVVEDASGCDSTINNIDLFSYTPLGVIARRSGINQFVAQADGGNPSYEYSIDGVNFSSSNVFDIGSTGVYTVTTMDQNGCIAEAEIDFVYNDIYVPNYFSPNGDGIADYWYPERIEFFPNTVVEIFDRYARLLVTYKGNVLGWDGTYENKPLPSGDYWYVIKLNDGRTDDIKGHFTLYR